MQQAIKKAFPKVEENQCLESTEEPIFEIYENERKASEIRIPKENPMFLVENPSKKTLYFLKIDHCLFFDEDTTKRCDCAVFDNETFCFVELSEADLRNRKSKRKAAYAQLFNTIQLFQSKGISFERYKLQAAMVFDFRNTFPLKTATSQDAVIEFANEFNADLCEGNGKEF